VAFASAVVKVIFANNPIVIASDLATVPILPVGLKFHAVCSLHKKALDFCGLALIIFGHKGGEELTHVF
jgi:hypothetical protein